LVVELTKPDQDAGVLAWFWIQGLLAAKDLGRWAGAKACIKEFCSLEFMLGLF